MKKEKILINIENINNIDEYKKIGINNFLFAVNSFSIGYNSFNIDDVKDIKCNKYLLLNKIFNNEDCDNLFRIINQLKVFDGIIFEDIAVYNILKNSGIKLIWNQIHFATNYKSINYWLEMVDSAILSNELTKEEVIEIIDKCDKKIILNVFGKNPAMYSRRELLSNYNDYFNLDNNREVILKENSSDNEFLVKEDSNGTFIFNNSFFSLLNYIDCFNDDKILFYLIYPDGANIEDIMNNSIEANDGFMNKKTIYKIGV